MGLYGYEDIGPNVHCELHAKIGLDFPLNEYRACWKMAGQPLVQRLRDKQHNWEDLGALIPDMLVLGLLGHPFACPDLIGGGEISSFIDKTVLDEELIVRAAQVHALMPMMQFSVAPWRVLGEDNLAICKQMAELHHNMGNEIIALARESAESGEPMVRHMEYAFPGYGYSDIKNQFMLGDRMLVAPLVEKGKRSRMVSFPPGRWKGDDCSIIEGPIVKEIDVPLERLPWYQQ